MSTTCVGYIVFKIYLLTDFLIFLKQTCLTLLSMMKNGEFQFMMTSMWSPSVLALPINSKSLTWLRTLFHVLLVLLNILYTKCRKLFELLVLSGALAELTWPTILSKRHIFRYCSMKSNVLIWWTISAIYYLWFHMVIFPSPFLCIYHILF